MSIKAAIFDWDGTVVDSVEHITDCLHHAAASTGFPTLERAAYRNIIGLGIVEALRRLYPGLTDLDTVRMREAYSSHFMATSASNQRIFPGMTDILRELHATDRRCAVATGKSRRGLDQALTSSQLAPWFHITRCADETRSKPDPRMLIEILEHLELEPADAVMIGDTSYDLQMAQAIGMPSIGVRWGVHGDEVLSLFKPIAIVSTSDELRELLIR
ncbi:MAG: HAD-IA family hydrolase [Pseudohongiella sp.]|nr:HAD-IA family hydrolase [Pseudohongiella sp.]